MVKLIAIIGAVVMGIFAALQQIVNARLGKFSSPLISTFQNFLLGTITLFIILVLSRQIPTYLSIFKLPWYLLFAGFFGLFIVYSAIRIIPIIGFSNMTAIMLSTWLILSFIIDSFGLFGVTRVEFDMSRVIGSVLLVVGILLVTKAI